MKTPFTLWLIVFPFVLFAREQTVIEQVKTVNSNWNNIPAFTPLLLEQKQINSEKELIQTHLGFVIQYLENRNPHLSKGQRVNRINCINKLKEYCRAAVFPINNRHTCRQPYFIDDFNNYCAVGYLLKETGFDKTARQIHNEMNYAYVQQIPAAYIQPWAIINGFMLDELALIQPTYAPWVECRDDVFYVGKNSPAICPVMKNDIIRNEDSSCQPTLNILSFTLLDSAIHGTASLIYLPNDTFLIYQPDSNFSGIDSIHYAVLYMAGPFCGWSDTATVIFNVLVQPGNYISFIPGDGNYDGFIEDNDLLFLAKNIGEAGSPRLSNLGNCVTNYSSPWNSSYMGNNAVATDADGNGSIDEADFDYLMNCFNPYTNFLLEGSPSGFSIVTESYDSTISPGKNMNLVFSISNGVSSVPVKALTMIIEVNRDNRINLAASQLMCRARANGNFGIDEKKYSVFLQDWIGSAFHTGTFSVSNFGTPPVQFSIPVDSFAITSLPIVRDSIKADGTTIIYLTNIYALDTDDNIIQIENRIIPFKTSTISRIEEPAIFNIRLFPNPAGNQLFIEADNVSLQSISFFNITGQLMQTIEQPGNHPIDISDLDKGVYIAELKAEGAVVKRRWVKM